MNLRPHLLPLTSSCFLSAPSPPLQPQWGVPHREQPGFRLVRHHGGGRGRSLLWDATGGRAQAQHQLSQHPKGTYCTPSACSGPGEDRGRQGGQGGEMDGGMEEGREGHTICRGSCSLSQALQSGPSWLCPAELPHLVLAESASPPQPSPPPHPLQHCFIHSRLSSWEWLCIHTCTACERGRL